MLTQFSLCEEYNGADLAIVLDICNRDVISTEEAFALELLVETGEKFLEELFLFSLEFLGRRSLVSKSLWLNYHLDKSC